MIFSKGKRDNLFVVQEEIVSLLAKYGYTYEESGFILDDVKRKLMEQVVQFPHGCQSVLDDMANALKRSSVSLIASTDKEEVFSKRGSGNGEGCPPIADKSRK